MGPRASSNPRDNAITFILTRPLLDAFSSSALSCIES
jgi:hypothetical protein